MSDDLTGLGLIDLIDLLDPAPEPAPVSLMPATPAWIVLGAVLALACILLLRRYRRHARAEAYRRDALRALDAAGEDPAAIAVVLRRAALSAYPRRDVAGLHGEAWLRFLDEAYGGTGFASGPGRVISTAPYRSVSADPGLAALARDWVRRHRRLEP
jgi:Ca-activated chloride channel family protein